MLIRLKIPKTIMWVINLLFIFLLIFTLFRMATYFSFRPKDLGFDELIPSFLLGVGGLALIQISFNMYDYW